MAEREANGETETNSNDEPFAVIGLKLPTIVKYPRVLALSAGLVGFEPLRAESSQQCNIHNDQAGMNFQAGLRALGMILENPGFVRDNLQTLYAAIEDGFASPLPAFPPKRARARDPPYFQSQVLRRKLGELN